MWITHDATLALVEQSTDDELRWLREYLQFNDPGARYHGGKRTVGMLSELTRTFPVGLLAMVRSRAAKDGVKFDVLDRSSPLAPVDNADLAWLRDYQLAAVRTCLQDRRGMVWVPTAGGKTEIAAGLVRSVPDAHWLFLVHRMGLVTQAADRVEARCPELGPVGRVGEGRWSVGPHLTCATFQAVAAALRRGDSRGERLLKWAHGLMVDEAHTLPAETYYDASMLATNAAYRIGFSGTPLSRGDRRSVLAVASLGPIIFRVRPDVLVERGQLARPHVRMVRCEQDSSLLTNYAAAYGRLVERSAVRNGLLVDVCKKAEKPAVLFVRTLEHVRTMERELTNAGVACSTVSGQHSQARRASAAKGLVAGRSDVLIATVVMQEGVDIPAIRSVVVGAAGASAIAAIQRAGRGMRVERDADGNAVKQDFTVWDVLDTGNRHLERHARARRHAYLKERYELFESDSP
jgi:superfamily II DNA or RNA helicase